MNNAWRNNKAKPLSLKEQINEEDGSLTIYRNGEIGMTDDKNGISFYGLSKSGISCYQERVPGYHKWILPKEIVDNIVDLHSPENQKIIEELERKHPIFKKTLFSNGDKVCRRSDSSDTDRKMVGYLKAQFPGKIGSYTQKGPYLHSEIIIWDSDLNETLHNGDGYEHEPISEMLAPPPLGRKDNRKRKRNNNNSSGVGKALKFDGGGTKKKTKTKKLKKRNRKTKKRSRKHKK